MLTLENRYIARDFLTSGGDFTSSAIHNRLTGERFPLDSAEFSLMVADEEIGPERFRLTCAPKIQNDGSRQLLEARYALPSHDTQVMVTYSLDEDSPVLRKRVSVENPPAGLRWMDVEVLKLSGAELQSQGPGDSTDPEGPDKFINTGYHHLGQPLFARTVFLGLEYPAAENVVEPDGTVRLRRRLGFDPDGAPITTPDAVVGVCSDRPGDRTRDAFLRYLDTVRAQPVKARVLLSTWYAMNPETGLFPPGERNTLDFLDGGRRAFADRGLSPDYFVIDGGWEDNLWRPLPDCWPEGMTPVARKLEEMGTNLGMWIAFSGGPELAPLDWYAERGYEVNQAGRCFAGPKWRQIIKDAVTERMTRDRVKYWKVDFTDYVCDESSHGHRPGEASIPACTDAMIDIIRTMRSLDPKVLIYDAYWLSPWWLMYADVAWMWHVDFHCDQLNPSRNNRAAAITARDGFLRRRLVENGFAFPWSSIDDGGIIKASSPREFSVDSDSPAEFLKDALMHFGRGLQHNQLYVDPHCLKKELGADVLDDLRSIVRWGCDASRVLLADTRMILGDPLRGEPYGYSHVSGDGREALIFVRNPGMMPAKVRIDLGEEAGFADGGREYVAARMYPANRVLPGHHGARSAIEAEMEPHEVAVYGLVERGWADIPLPQGTLYYPVSVGGAECEFRIFGRPGERWQIVIAGVDPREAEVEIDGAPVRIGDFCSFEDPGQTAGIAVAEAGMGAWDVHVPGDVEAPELIVLAAFDGAHDARIGVRIDGREADVALRRPNEGLSSFFKEYVRFFGRDWCLGLLPLPSGRMKLEIRVTHPEEADPTFQAYVHAMSRLAEKVLRVRHRPRERDEGGSILSKPLLSGNYMGCKPHANIGARLYHR